MALRILDLVDADTEADISLLSLACGQDDLCEIHRDLLEAAPRGGEYLEAATLVSTLSGLLSTFPGADPRTVGMVMASMVLALRARAWSAGDRARRFATTYGWLDHLRIQKRAADAKAKAEAGEV